MMIISGGQTGVDRAALDVAIELGIPHGGFVPKGRLAEDGPLPAHYQMTELSSVDYADRTKANVDWGDGTLILYRDHMTSGTRFTWEYAKNRGKQILALNLDEDPSAVIRKIQAWIADLHPPRLNVAGPRESGSPGIYKESRSILRKSLK